MNEWLHYCRAVQHWELVVFAGLFLVVGFTLGACVATILRRLLTR